MKTQPHRSACAALDKSIKIFNEKVALAKPLAISAKGKKALAKMTPPVGSLADNCARQLAGRFMIAELLEHHQRTKKKGYKHFLVTFCWDAGVLPSEATTEFDLQAMQIKAYKALKSIRLSGVGVFEVVALCRSKHNPERLIIHLHFVCWTTNEHFKPKRSAKRLQGSFPNSLGAPSVSIQSRKMAATRFKDKRSTQYVHLFSKLHKDQTKASMAHLGYYLFQAPAWAKQIVPKKDRVDRLAMRSTAQKYTPQLALAVEQLMGRISIMEAIFSVGDGKTILTPWRRLYRKSVADKDEAKMKRRKLVKAAVRRRRARLLKRLGRMDREDEG